MTTPEPFGYFNNPCLDGWQDCAETDEGAKPLYDQEAIDALVADAERLEWLVKAQCVLIKDFDGLVFPYWHTSGRRGEVKSTFREAIDAAIACAKETK